MAKILAMAAALGLIAVAGCGDGHDHGQQPTAAPAAKAPEAPPDPNAKPYPLKTCIVSGEALGSMGEPPRFTYKGQEIKLCCSGCRKKFDENADKFLEKLAAGAAEKK